MSQSPSEIIATNSGMESTSEQSPTPLTEEKIERVKITLDNPQNTYSTGQTIRGTISLNCTQKTQIRGIYFRVIGYGKCNWTDLLRRDSIPVDAKNDKSDIKFWGDEEYLNATVYVIGSKNGRPFPLLKGTTTYNFSFNLNTNLPSSFAGDCGKIKYKMEFIIDKPWKFDDKHVIVLNVIRMVDLNESMDAIKAHEQQLTKNVGFIDSGPISLHVSVPKLGYVFEEIIPIQAIISNHSKVRVEKLKFALYKVVEYHSVSPSRAIKRVMERLIKKVVDGVDRKTEQTFQQTIDVPVTTPTQDEKISKLIHIKYELKVEIKLGTLHKNLVMTIPIVIGNVPYFIKEPDPTVLRSSLPQQMPMTHDSNSSRASILSNWSLDLYPQINADRSSMRTSMQFGAISPITSTPNAPFGTSMNVNHSYPMMPVSPIIPISSMSSISSISSIPSMHMINNSSLPQERPMSVNFPPSAPPMDFGAASTPIRPHSLFIDSPPSYHDICGLPSQLNQLHFSNSPSCNHNTSTKS